MMPNLIASRIECACIRSLWRIGASSRDSIRGMDGLRIKHSGFQYYKGALVSMPNPKLQTPNIVIAVVMLPVLILP